MKNKKENKKEKLKEVIDKKEEGVDGIIDFYLAQKKELGFKKPSDMLKWYYR